MKNPEPLMIIFIESGLLLVKVLLGFDAHNSMIISSSLQSLSKSQS